MDSSSPLAQEEPETSSSPPKHETSSASPKEENTDSSGPPSSRIPNRRVRKRPVSFGNPALGTYKGFVYTIDDKDTNNSNTNFAAAAPKQEQKSLPQTVVEDAELVENMVAMVDVPPEQVPEGVLNLSRSHRPFIDHVRIVIAQPQEKGDSDDGHVEDDAPAQQQQQPQQLDFEYKDDKDDTTLKPSRTYIVLFHLIKPEDAQTFVDDLDGQPFTSLDMTVTCHIQHVVALNGEGGVSLMNPIFAPSTKKAQHGALEILPSSSSEPDMSSTTNSTQHRPHGDETTHHRHHHVGGEDPNCAVCLERIPLDLNDADKTSILTTVCNHTFHLDCLVQCQDSPCPVCRYDHSGLNEALSQCHICGTTEHNYVCLICGVVSCIGSSLVTPSQADLRHSASIPCSAAIGTGACSEGVTSDSINNNDDHNGINNTARETNDGQENHAHRFFNSHASQHYDETLHAYALDTETQHVWDFCGQGYVHRLLQNKEDGKLVEVHDPNNTSQERSLRPGLSDAQEGEVVHRKLEGFASQYYTLLKSQLEQQRIFYEGRLQEIRREFAVKQNDVSKNKADLLAALKQERKQLTQRGVTLKRRHTKVTENVAFLRNMNESLESNKAPLQRKIEQAQLGRLESQQMIQKYLPALEEKVTSLMLQLEESATSCIGGASAESKQECAPDSKVAASTPR